MTISGKSFTTGSFRFISYPEMSERLSDLVLSCRNDDRIRRWMVNKSAIDPQSHRRFCDSLAGSENRLYYAVMSDNRFVGAVNLTLTAPHEAERGIFLNPDFFGQGLATGILKEFYGYIKENTDITTITSKVYKDNMASVSLEHKLGSILTSEDSEFLHYSLNL